MEWISVKDKLPGTESGILLVFNQDHGIELAYFISPKDGYFFCIGQDTKQTWEPEYWMKIPNQPERLSEKTAKADAIV